MPYKNKETRKKADAEPSRRARRLFGLIEYLRRAS
jgi:hypothetical protein